MTENPLHMGSQEQFARVREMFEKNGFVLDGVCAATLEDKVDVKSGFRAFLPQEVSGDLAPSEMLDRVFGPGDYIALSRLREFGKEAVDDLFALGLIRPNKADSNFVHATVRVRPMFRTWVLSDRWTDVDKQGVDESELEDDVVYPPDIYSALRYLYFISTRPSKRFLEVCGGSGAGALIAARNFAERAWSFDITERSTIFARFGGALSGLPNFSADAGDAYAPAGDLTFDRIAAHPPYVPTLEHTWTFHSGGPDGEQVTRKVVEGLPKHLEPGGRLFLRCLGSDRTDAPFEQRLREWLGEHQSQFDVGLLVLEAINPIYYVTDSILKGKTTRLDLGRWQKSFTAAGILRFVQSIVVVQRKAEDRPVFTIRRDASPKTKPEGFDWLLNWETLRAQGRVTKLLLDEPLVCGNVSLRTSHELSPTGWVPATHHLDVRWPLGLSWEVEPWAVEVLHLNRQGMTGRQLLRHLITNDSIAESITPEDFSEALEELVSGGMIYPQSLPPPSQKKE